MSQLQINLKENEQLQEEKKLCEEQFTYPMTTCWELLRLLFLTPNMSDFKF